MSALCIRFNGQERQTAALTLVQLLDELGFTRDRRGLAVALNGHVVPRGAWSTRTLAGGDRVEVVSAVQGG